MRIFFFLTAFLIVPYMVFGQVVSDTSKYEKHHFLTQYGLPVGLLTGSLILQTGDIKKNIQDFFPDTETHIDDWLKNGPEIGMYAFDLVGIKHSNTVFDQTKYLLISHLVTGGIVQFLKVTTHVTRPSGGKHSFPSGHTSYAFVGATVLYQEFKETAPLLAYSGFAMATATGILRITNDAHWLPDVMAGAAIGILVTNLVYQIEPFKKFQPFSQKCEINVIREKNVNLLCLQFSF
jgi:membrane-associated phospholipid phosphatase